MYLFRPRPGLAIFEACIIGLVAAIAAVILKEGGGFLGSLRTHAGLELAPWIALPVIGLLFGATAGLIIQYFAPEAAGAGISQVKASLAQYPVRLNWKVAWVKLVSCILVLGSGMALGRQGPTIHLGAALAGQLSQWVPTSPEYRRQMIASGAGAGLAAAFNAPIAGVIFVVEDLLKDFSGFTLGTAILASFIGGVVSRLLGNRSLVLNSDLRYFSSSFSLPEIPFYIVLGIIIGIAAALFSNGVIQSISLFRRYFANISLPIKMGGVGLLSGIVISLLPVEFHNHTGIRESMMLGSASWKVAALAFTSQFFLTILAAGTSAPGGLFAPSLIMGSSLGYLVGTLQMNILGWEKVNTYALAGMGAFFAAVSKAPITAIIIAFEQISNFNVVLPLMIAVVTAYLVSQRYAPYSLTDRILELNGINLKIEKKSADPLAELTAKDLMQPKVETLDSNMTHEEVVAAFDISQHRGFPVVADGKLVGIVTESDLVKLKHNQANNPTLSQLLGAETIEITPDTPLFKFMTPNPMTVNSDTSFADILYLLNRYKLSRLPVVDEEKVVGIITRSDLIRVEANQFNGLPKDRSEPSHIVYQTRSGHLGKGRILIPISNDKTLNALLNIAQALATEYNYDILCLYCHQVIGSEKLSHVNVNTIKMRRILRQAERKAQKWEIGVDTQIRLVRDIAKGIIETIKLEHIDLLVMGWTGQVSANDMVFGNITDQVIRHASCQVMLVKLAKINEKLIPFACPNVPVKRWLLPIGGGPNSQLAIKMLPALLRLTSHPEVRLLQVYQPSEETVNATILAQAARLINQEIPDDVTTTVLCSNSVATAVIDMALHDETDVIVLGASRETMFQQALRGNIPQLIATSVKSTVILVRTAQS